MSDSGPEKLFNTHLELASKVGRRFLIPGMSADESIQEARIALWQAANAFDPTRGAFEGFAVIVIRNHLRNVFGRARRTSAEVTSLDLKSSGGSEDGEGTEKENIPAPGADPLLEAERADISKGIQQSLDALTPPQKELLVRFAAGESYADIGREKNVSPAAVRQMAQRAMDKTRTELESRSINVRFMAEDDPKDDRSWESRAIPFGATTTPRESSSSAFGCLILGILFGAAAIISMRLWLFKA